MLDWWLPENVSTYGRDIDWLFHLIYYITGVTAILVFGTMLVFLVMYRDRPGRRARYTHGNTTLEIVWTVDPGADPRRPHVPQRADVVEDQDGRTAAQRLRAAGHRQAVQLAGHLPGADGKFGTAGRQDAARRDARAGQQGRARPSAVAGRHPQLLRAPVPHEAGRGARARDRAVVRGDQGRQVRGAVRRAVRLRSLRHARLGLRGHAGRVREVGGRELRAEAAPAAAPDEKKARRRPKPAPPAAAKGGKAKR